MSDKYNRLEEVVGGTIAEEVSGGEMKFYFDKYGHIRYRDLTTGRFASKKEWDEAVRNSDWGFLPKNQE